MAAYAACRRLGRFSTKSGFNLATSRALFASKLLDSASSIRSSLLLSPTLRFDCRPISQNVKSNGKRLFLVDTLALVRRLEAQGVPSKQAEAITAAITEVLNDSLENVAQSFVSKAEMQKIEMVQESNLSKFKSEVQSSQEKRGGARVAEFGRIEGF
uniref:Putative Coiled-coil domain-containing protein 90 n=1 Tax=Davidia involucrata TaxID=16924 RepID=A0A5B7C9N6_DAVIN